MPAKKTRKARKSTTRSIRPKNPAPMSETAVVRAVPTSVTAITRSPLTPRAVFVGAICVMAAAVLIAARQPFQQSDVASISAPPTTTPLAEEIALPKPPAPPAVIASPAAMASAESTASAARLETKKTVPPKPVAVAVARPSAADASTEKTASAETAKALAAEPVSSAPKADTTTSVVESTSNVAGRTATSVTITGCVANDEATFWLKDTSGADAPKSRNWKSGFLKKRPAPIALLDATHALKLPNYVGQRVAATGTLVNREMRAHALQRVAASCG